MRRGDGIVRGYRGGGGRLRGRILIGRGVRELSAPGSVALDELASGIDAGSLVELRLVRAGHEAIHAGGGVSGHRVAVIGARRVRAGAHRRRASHGLRRRRVVVHVRDRLEGRAVVVAQVVVRRVLVNLTLDRVGRIGGKVLNPGVLQFIFFEVDRCFEGDAHNSTALPENEAPNRRMVLL